MRAFATTNPVTVRRWEMRAVVVVLVHGAIVTAVVTWRKVTVPAEPLGPVVIELAPMPAAPITQQAALPPAPEQVPSSASPDKTPEKVEQKAEEKTAARGEEKAEPSQFEESPRVTAPVTLAPPESAEGGNRGDTKAGPSGQAGGEVQPGGGGEPHDTRIGEQPRKSFKKAAKANDWTKAIMGHPSKNFAGRQQPLGPGTASGMARNAIGMLVQDPAGAMGTKGSTAADAAKIAVGGTAMKTPGGAAGGNGTPPKAHGARLPVPTAVPRRNIVQRATGRARCTSTRARPRGALAAHCRTPASIPPKGNDDKWRSRFETRLVTGCSSVCPMTSMTSTSNDSAICSNRLITTVRRAIAKSAVKTALPVANKNGKKNTDLEGQVASGCPARGPLELVAPPKFIAFDLQIAEMPAQAWQLGPSLRRFGAGFAYGRRCSLPNCPEPPVQVGTGQTLLIRSELARKRPMAGVLTRFDAPEA